MGRKNKTKFTLSNFERSEKSKVPIHKAKNTIPAFNGITIAVVREIPPCSKNDYYTMDNGIPAFNGITIL